MGLQQPGLPTNNNTLSEIAAEDNLDSSIIMDTLDENNTTDANKTPTTQSASRHNRGESERNSISKAHMRPSRSDAVADCPPYGYPDASYETPSSSQSCGHNRRGGGRGRGNYSRGRNSRGNRNHQRYSSTKTGKQYNILTDSDRMKGLALLGINLPGETSSQRLRPP